MSSGVPIFEAIDLTKQFRRGLRSFTAVDGVSFAVPRGSVFGLVGESGSGKTTLARTMLHLEPPTSGRVLFDGADISGLNRRELRLLRAKMQIVFQDPNAALNPKLRVRTSLLEGVENIRVPKTERLKRLDEACEQVGISPAHLSRKPSEFSGGQKQRLVIARTLTMRPDVLVLDEPVSNLDVSVQAQIINLLVDLQQRLDLTYLFISHDLNLVAYLSDMIAVMHDGRIIEIGTAEEIINRPLHVYTRNLFAASARIVDRTHRPKSPVMTSEPPADRSTRGCAFLESCTIASSKCMTGRPEFRWSRTDRGVACFETDP